VQGSFALILFGGAYKDDLETIALLDNEGDEYSIEPYAPEFDYVTKRRLSAEEALAQASRFVSFHHAFWKIHLSKILGPDGTVIGFEVKPLYFPFIYGISDVLDVSYWPKKDGKVKVVIRLLPSLETLKYYPGGDGGPGGGN